MKKRSKNIIRIIAVLGLCALTQLDAKKGGKKKCEHSKMELKKRQELQEKGATLLREIAGLQRLNGKDNKKGLGGKIQGLENQLNNINKQLVSAS